MASGGDAAFRAFYDGYYYQIYRYASCFVASRQLVEEIVSDVFCAIWQNRKRIAGIGNFEGYLYTITKNRALYYLSREHKLSLADMDIAFHDLPDHETPEIRAIENEFNTALQNAIDELPEKCRRIFLLAREEGLKYREIAEKLSISEKTVNAQMVLAIKKLSKKTGKLFFFLL